MKMPSIKVYLLNTMISANFCEVFCSFDENARWHLASVSSHRQLYFYIFLLLIVHISEFFQKF